MKYFSALFFMLPTFIFSQISGSVKDKSNKEGLVGAKIFSSNNAHAVTDLDGNFRVVTKEEDFPITLITSLSGYQNDTLVVQQPGEVTINLFETAKTIETVVVTAGRRGQKIEEVTVSMDVLRPDLVDNKGFRDLEDAIDQVPGVQTMDGQVSIRGGAGFAYGAGSRVMVLWDGMPLVSADAGDVKFNSIPMESASQIEVIKGASSVLYGSGALNGIISLTERIPDEKGEFRMKYQIGLYGNPKRSSLRWWKTNPMFDMLDLYYGKRFGQVGFTLSANKVTAQGYRQGEDENRGRISGTFFYHPKQVRGLKTGVNFNAQLQRNNNFMLWESDSLGYQPMGGANPEDPASTIGFFRGVRVNVDPYIKYFDKYNNAHSLKSRFYYVQNKNIYNPTQTSTSLVSYGDYQYQRKFDFGMTVTTGLTVIHNGINANLYGKHSSLNGAFYLQLEQKLWKKLDLTAGVRAEYYEQDGRQGDSYFYLKKDSTAKMPIYPVFRAGIHYEPVKGTHLRASYGQGIRYPSVAERYTVTSVGALNIFPNPSLRPERGWAAEFGIKQVIPIGQNWKGIFDVAGFVNQYDDMMEFEFGIYNPDSISLSIDPNNPGYLGKWIGFRAANNESARIMGLEATFSSIGKIGQVELASMIGYTYMNPISLNTDSLYLLTLSTYKVENGVESYDKTLKYRFRHMFKGDIEATWRGASLGFSARYTSRVANIDRIFEEGILGQYILPGLREYREKNDKGALVFDARIGYRFLEHYRVSFIVNNLLNNEYVTRPGDIQPPRTFILQVQLTF
ncbi:MAG: TonB-dependent receptor [Crocinitomicaceae bacterium]|nr:TonB-dependent receptor [Crocinitomicaceae bacterium]